MTLKDAPAWTAPTRRAGLALLDAFRPRMGRAYARERNVDRGPGRHRAVSRLSPYLRRRLVSEPELVEAALRAHGLQAAEKFVQEVFWRGYFKGWLERRPAVWADYRDGLLADLATHGQNPALARAEAGQTGIACFDAWARELTRTGYLHNHARMWFASIWIFTLELPWRLGADFFYRHLLDGDPAANTLSWRWVAGLHTPGKAYAARAWNIAKFTDGRFRPAPGEINEDAVPLEEPGGLPPPQPLRQPVPVDPTLPTALLITEEDCQPETLGLDLSGLVATATLGASQLRSPRPVAAAVAAFEAGALADAAARAETHVAPSAVPLATPDELAAWAESTGARQLVTAYIPEGPLRDRLTGLTPALAEADIRLAEIRRPWDDAIWPHATAGFFKVKAQIPAIIQRLGLPA